MHIFSYQTGIRGYKVYDINSYFTFVSKNVILYEKEFPLSKQISFSPQESDSDLVPSNVVV